MLLKVASFSYQRGTNLYNCMSYRLNHYCFYSLSSKVFSIFPPISATKRRSIKGAAGRPVQFKYPETPLSPSTLESREIQLRLVPLWVQIVVFLLVAALLYFVYMSIEESLNSDDLALMMNSQDTHTWDRLYWLLDLLAYNFIAIAGLQNSLSTSQIHLTCIWFDILE